MSEQELQIKALECRIKELTEELDQMTETKDHFYDLFSECHEALDIIFCAFPEEVLKDQLGEDFEIAEKAYIQKPDIDHDAVDEGTDYINDLLDA